MSLIPTVSGAVHGCGLFNQLNTIINAIVRAVIGRAPGIIIGDFLPHFNLDTQIPIGEVLDMPYLQQIVNTLALAPIRIMDATKTRFELVSAHYGQFLHLVDLTDEFKAKFWHENRLVIPVGTILNNIKGDPRPREAKTLFLRFRIYSDGNLPFDIYLEQDENINQEIIYHLDVETSARYYPHGPYLEYHDRIIQHLRFQPIFQEKSDAFVQTLNLKETSTVNLIHLRDDADMLKNGSYFNNITGQEFIAAIRESYRLLIDLHFDLDDDIIVLTVNPENPLCDYLKERGYRYHVNLDKPPNQREINGIVELLTADYCNHKFIGNLNPEDGTGSHLSYAIWKRLRPNVECFFVDIFNLRNGIHHRITKD